MARHLKPKKSRKGLKITAGVIASVVFLGAAGAGYTYWNLNNRIQQNSVDITANEAPEAPKVKPKIIEEKVTLEAFDGAFTVLLVGNDDGNGEEQYGSRDHALNDVNILLHVSEDHSKATAISVPRDMLIDAPSCTDPVSNITEPAAYGVKINTALSRGGLKCVVDTFRELTGQTIDYAAMIQFNGVISMSNAVGGVPVCVTTDIDDPYSGLKMAAGENVISGNDALAFLRTRHGVGDGSDLARISNQQVFLSSLMKTLKSKETLSDPKKVYGIANAVADNMTLSSNLASIPTLASLAYSLKDIPLEKITFVQYPTTYDASLENVFPNSEAAFTLVEAVFSGKDMVITGGSAPGSIGAVDRGEEVPPVEPSPETAPPTPVEPAIPSDPAEGEVIPPPPTTEAPVELPSGVTGITASQNTCSRGFGDY